MTQHLQPHASAAIDKACGHLHVRVVIKPHLASSHGRFFLSTRMSPSASAEKQVDVPAQDAPRLDVSWYDTGHRKIDEELPTAVGSVTEQLGASEEEAEEEQLDGPGLDVERSGSSSENRFGTGAWTAGAQSWGITVHELVGLLPERVRGSGYRVAFFSGLDGSLLGATSSWSSPGGVWQHNGGRHVVLEGLQDTKVPIVAKILSAASLSKKRNRPLVVEVKAARGLTAMDSGGTSDPYVTLSVGRSQRYDKRAQSKCVSKSLNPNFDEEVQIWMSEKEIAEENLLVQIWDKDLIGSDDLIGQVSMSLHSLTEPNFLSTPAEWLTILGSSGSSAGEVLLGFQLPPPLPPVPLSLMTERRAPRLRLIVYLVEARGLLAADMGGTSDPYATLELGCDYLDRLGDASVNNGRTGSRILGRSLAKEDGQQAKSGVKKATLEPVWHESFTFDLPDYPALLDANPDATRVQVFEDERPSTESVTTPTAIEFNVVEGRGLRAMDRGNTSDPYLTLQVGAGKGMQCKTKVIKKNLNPQWNETLKLLASEEEMRNESVLVQVWDKDLIGSDDLIGAFSLPLAAIADIGSGGPSGSLAGATVSEDAETSAKAMVSEELAGGTGDPTPSVTWYTLLDAAGNAAGEVLLGIPKVAPARDAASHASAQPTDEHHANAMRAQTCSKGTWLTVHVFDHDALSKDDSLGLVRIRLEDVFPELHSNSALVCSSSSQCLLDEWFDLLPAKGKNKALGQVHLNLAITVDSPTGVSDANDENELGSVLIGLDELPFPAQSACAVAGADVFHVSQDGRVPKAVGVNQAQEAPTGEAPPRARGARRCFTGEFAGVCQLTPLHAPLKLVAVVEEAKSLISADRNGFSDPYVVLSLVDRLGTPIRTCQTRVIFKNLNPIWQEALTLPVNDLHGELRVHVFDSDMGGLLNSDDLIAQYSIPLAFLDEQGIPLLRAHVPAHGVRKTKVRQGPKVVEKPPVEHKRGRMRMLNEKFDSRANKIKAFILDPLADSPALLPDERAALKSPVKPSTEQDPVLPVSGARVPLGAPRADGPAPTARMQLKRMFSRVLHLHEDEDASALAHHGHHHQHWGVHDAPMYERELEVVVVSARHLPKMDLVGTVDAYCVLHYRGQHHKTSIKSNTYSPDWSEIFTFGVSMVANRTPGGRVPERRMLSGADNLMLRVFDHDALGKDDKVGDAFISGQRLAEISQVDSGSSVEIKVPILKRNARKSRAQSAVEGSLDSPQSPTHNSRGPRMTAVIGNDGIESELTLRVRLRPTRQYPANLFKEYPLDNVSASSDKEAGLLRMALVLAPSVQGGLICEHPRSDVTGQGASPLAGRRGTGVTQSGMALRATVFAPASKLCSSATGPDGGGSPHAALTPNGLSRLSSPPISPRNTARGSSPYSSPQRLNLSTAARLSTKWRQRQEEPEGLGCSIGLVQVRAVGVRNLALRQLVARLSQASSGLADQELGEALGDCQVFLTVLSSGQEGAIKLRGKGKDAMTGGRRFETLPRPARLGPCWMQSGSLVTDLSNNNLTLQVWARPPPGSVLGSTDVLVARSTVNLSSLSARGRGDREQFGWWPLESVSSSDTARSDGHEQHALVSVIQARDLVSKRHGDAHPYVVVSVIVTGESHPAVVRRRTAYCKTKGSDNPIFDADLAFEGIPALHQHSFLSEELPGSGAPSNASQAERDALAHEGWDGARSLGTEGFLLVQVFDAATTFKSKTFLGQAMVSLSAADGKSAWYRLHGRGRVRDALKPRRRPHVADESLGAIELSVELTDRGWLQPHVLMGLRPLHAAHSILRSPPSEIKEEAALRGERLLSVTVVSATKLAAADVSGTSDPYVVLSLNSSPSTPFFTSSVKQETLRPVWDESSWAYVPRMPADATLHVKIMDHDKFGKHDLLGRVDIPLNSLQSGRRYDRWCKIDGQKSCAGMLSVAVRRAKGLPGTRTQRERVR